MRYFRWMLGVAAVTGAIFAAQPAEKPTLYFEAPTITVTAPRATTLFHEATPIVVTAQRAASQPARS